MEKKNNFKLDTSKEVFFGVISGCNVYILNPEKRLDAAKRLFEFGARGIGVTLYPRKGE